MAEEYLPPLLTEKQHQRLREVLDLSIEGDGSIEVNRQPGTHRYRILDKRPKSPARQTNASEEILDAKITSVTAINGLIRWKYTIELGRWDMTQAEATGGTWTAITTAIIYAFNSAEDKNTFTGTGTIGTGNTGVDQATGAVGSCTLLPLPVGAYVVVKFRGVGAQGQSYYTILNAMNSSEV